MLILEFENIKTSLYKPYSHLEIEYLAREDLYTKNHLITLLLKSTLHSCDTGIWGISYILTPNRSIDFINRILQKSTIFSS
jgi:hypothetical protein